MTQITRRSMILGAASGTLAAASGLRVAKAQTQNSSQSSDLGSSKKPSPGSQSDVLVIGAGLSGLSSALMLEEECFDVQVIEGRNRVGGRVYTRFDLPGYPEVGGNGFGAGYGRVLDAARRMELQVVEFSERRKRHPKLELVFNGQVVAHEDWPSSPFNHLPPQLREKMPWEMGYIALQGNNPLEASDDWRSPANQAYDISIHDFLLQRKVPEEVIRLGFSVNPYFGSSAHDVSALQYLYNSAWGASQSKIAPHIYSILGGNQQLPIAMSEKLKRPVELDREVIAISTTDKGVEVHCADGSLHKARRLICSLPYSVLRNIRFDPILTGAQENAVSTLNYMVNTIIFFKPLRPFWEEDGMSPTMWTDGMLGTVVGQRFGESDDEVTTLFVNPRGKWAAFLDRLPREEAISRVLAEIERIRPKARGALECTGFHSWNQDPFSAGDWAIFAPGQISQFGNAMATIHGNVHFCGEHTAVANRGMEVAMESAERVGFEVMTAL